MGEEEAATLEGQFNAFSRLFDKKRLGLTITLSQNDYWMRQANIIDDRKITMTDTGTHFFKFEWLLCHYSHDMPIVIVPRMFSPEAAAFHMPYIIVHKKSEITWDEWLEFVSDLCRGKNLDEQMTHDALTNCGIPGQTTVEVPEFKNYFKTYEAKQKGLY